MKKLVNFVKSLFRKKPVFDRNYHHYVITEHCRSRMKQRNILYKDVNLCFKYGKVIENQIVLDISHIPSEHFEGLEKNQIKHILSQLPLVITLKEGTNIITTVYKGNNSIRTPYDLKLYNAYLKELK